MTKRGLEHHRITTTAKLKRQKDWQEKQFLSQTFWNLFQMWTCFPFLLKGKELTVGLLLKYASKGINPSEKNTNEITINECEIVTSHWLVKAVETIAFPKERNKSLLSILNVYEAVESFYEPCVKRNGVSFDVINAKQCGLER